MHAASILPLRKRRSLTGVLTLALGFGAVSLAQAHPSGSATNAPHLATDTPQQHEGPTTADGLSRGIIFVGGRKRHSDSSSKLPAHPPGPCTPSRQTAGQSCSLNPQPIPPGHSLASSTSVRDKSALETPTVPRRHRPAVPHHGET